MSLVAHRPEPCPELVEGSSKDEGGYLNVIASPPEADEAISLTAES